MLNVNLAQNEYIDLISEFESNNFHGESYSKNAIIDIMNDNHILKNNTNIFTLTENEELLGYIIFSINEDFTDIFKIFIREHDRQKGYATKLLDTVYNLAKRYNSKKIMVEVRSNNKSAISFYERSNFKYISTRKSYYKNPDDDALIYERII